MNNVKRIIWGRTLQLKVSYDCFEDEEILASQEEALNSLLANWNTVDKSLDILKEQCVKDSGGTLSRLDVDNVFKYVIPRSLFVVRKPKGVVALMCDYKLDLEHGLAVVFKNNKLWKIGQQDIVM